MALLYVQLSVITAAVFSVAVQDRSTQLTLSLTDTPQGMIINSTLQGSVKLVGGPHPWEGRIEIFHDGQWGTICDDMWGRAESIAACRQAGYAGGRGVYSDSYGTGNGTIWLDNVVCPEGEVNLTNCHHQPWGQHNCVHEEDVAVSCDNQRWVMTYSNVEGSVKLVGGPGPWEGRVEIFHDGEWGTICDDWWGRAESIVACRQAGYAGGRGVYSDSYGTGNGTIWLDSVMCPHDVVHLTDCQHQPWGEHDCRHKEDIAVICDNEVTDNFEDGQR